MFLECSKFVQNSLWTKMYGLVKSKKKIVKHSEDLTKSLDEVCGFKN